MNKWIQESIELANSPGYLDKLSVVYPVTRETERPLTPEVKSQLEAIYDARDGLALIRMLLKLKKFPIKDPYIAFLRKKRGQFIGYNPETVDRIAQTLLLMSFEKLMEGCEEPKEFNRQIGMLFSRWLPKLDYPFLSEEEFNEHKSTAFCLHSFKASQLPFRCQPTVAFADVIHLFFVE